MNNSFLRKPKTSAGNWIILLASSFLLLSACNSNMDSREPKSDKTENHNHNPDNEKAMDSDAGELQLNNGAKWKADAATNANVGVLQKIVAQQQPADINEYQQRGKQLQEAINKMIEECRMGGPEHEALHHWLEPLMKDVGKLQQAESADQALEIHGRIKSQILSYENSFE